MVITTSTDISYTDPLKRTDSADLAVKLYSQRDTRDLAQAVVRCTPQASGGLTWHTGGTDPAAPTHLTVDYGNSYGQHVTTKHVKRDGDRKL
ncbi:hypothetical protein G6O67_001929 [Ophiocordyceps sinensis]|uniref:Uncharacterized protein n=1 Tax=Ophiocordyceps sinensis TaxID=72228 RepID=A0A8H4PT83_9HYPO|nr:hypothetical protein G6O67_001929 [Ophiocordyceps sinensis]